MTDELRLPCQESPTPDDWFIREDGKQYPSDELLTHAQQQDVADQALAAHGDGEGVFAALEKALARAEVDAKTAALQRRRHAKEACVFSCPVRLACLDVALATGETHGTWGGHYEEEIAEISDGLLRRRRERELRLINASH